MLKRVLPITSALRVRPPLFSATQKIFIVVVIVICAALSDPQTLLASINSTNTPQFMHRTFVQSTGDFENPFKKVTQPGEKLAKQFQVLGIGEKREVLTPTPITANPALNQAGQWGVAKQIDAHTWSVKLGEDDHMATPQEILVALNNYRQKHGKSALGWDAKLADYAQLRASHFTAINTLDGHAGFSDFIDHNDGFQKLGFAGLGENSSIGYKMIGVHLIEWVYAADAEHDANQLDRDWTDVGIGVDATSTDLVFGGSRLQ